VIRRGEIWWAALPDPVGSGPGFRRPVVVVQSDAFNRSRIGTVVVATISSNLELAAAPGNVLLPRRASGLARASVVNVSQLVTLDRELLTECVRSLAVPVMARIKAGLRLVLALGPA